MIEPRELEDPAFLHHRFQSALNTADLDGLLELYEPHAVLVDRTGDLLGGHEQIGEFLSDLLSIAPKMVMTPVRQIDAGDIKVLISDWQLTGTSPDGTAILDQGHSYDVVRRQPDRTWKLVVNNPWSVEPSD